MATITGEAAARELLEILDTSRSIPTFTSRDPTFDVGRAYDATSRVHAHRVARGERPVGRKIGFTNRTIWDEYGIHEPIWGYVYDSTLVQAEGGRATVDVSTLAEPRIEPEIVLQFHTAPPMSRDEDAILGSIRWIAHGFEIVQSPFPGWRFKVADTVSVNGLHGRLVVGDPVPVSAIADCAERLRSFTIALSRGEELAAEGGGASVLDSPLLALAHLVHVLAGLPLFPPIAAGEVVTTGTLTRALPIERGQTWSTTLAGIALPGLTIALR